MIQIRKTHNADSRTASGIVSKKEVLQSSMQHIRDVQKAMRWMGNKLMDIGNSHDYTKITEIDSFYESFHRDQLRSEEVPTTFREEPWYKLHVATERHHLSDHVPDDVNLFDVLERIGDIVMASKGRGGELYSATLDPEILKRAYENTVRLLQKNVEVIE